MTNPGNAIGTNGAFNGRTSPNALNDIAGAFTKGIAGGWTCRPKSGMTVQLGGDASTRDVAVAEDNAGNKLTINNRSGAPVEVTLTGAPATNNRIDAIVAYVDSPSTGDGGTTDNPSTCGIIAVSGTVAANPVPPTEAQIRAAITADGATGGVAYFATLATILVGTNVTSIGSGVITQGAHIQSTTAIADGSITTNAIANGAITAQKISSAYYPALTHYEKELTTSTNFGNGQKVFDITVAQAGTYILDATFYAPGSTSYGYLGISARKGSNEFLTAVSDCGTNGNRTTSHISGVVTINAGETISFYTILGGTTQLLAQATRASLVRIA